ncbi:hypothetical protein ACLM5J_19685 [Nocardioides sp. Bht2]|uniref:hypothetical protein n=1 Tax=Nocardioides sp. Bht2 TaxID=3392297 RepID=UPI0039B634A1
MAFLDEETPGWVRGVLALLALLVVAVVALVVVVVMNMSDDTKDDRDTAAVTGSPSVAPSACDLPSGDQRPPSAAPTVAWVTLSNGDRGPRSEAFGPAAEKDRVHSCFAKNPTGAALSATWYILDTGQNVDAAMGEQLWSRVSEKTRSEERKKSEVWNGQDEGEDEARPLTILGFRVVDSTPDRVVVEVLVEDVTSSQRIGFTFAQVWEAGDWRTDAPAGRMEDAVRLVEDSSAFLFWDGNY